MELKHTEKRKEMPFNQGHFFLFIMMFVVFFSVFNMLKPYLNTIVLAIILASVFKPFYSYLNLRLKNRPNLTATLSCLLLMTVVILPLTLISGALIQQGIHSFNGIQHWLSEGNLEKLMNHPWVQRGIQIVTPMIPDFHTENVKINQSLVQFSSSVGKFLFDQGGFLVANLTSLVAKFFLLLFVFFFMIRDGEKLLEGILHLVPLSSTQENRIIEKIKVVSRSVMMGTLLTAIAQGAAGGLAFWIAGLPGLFWGTIMAFASLIPVVGTALIWIPASGYLMISGNLGMGIFVIIWCAIVVGSIDNFLRPYFMQGSAGMSPLLIFFSILGGINYFGLIGILYGPLMFGLAMVLLYIYDLEFEPFLKMQDRT